MRLRFWRKPPPPMKQTGMRCIDCEKHILKREKFVIVAAQHRDCHDPKGVGQRHLLEEK